jgi:hypothetical protein
MFFFSKAGGQNRENSDKPSRNMDFKLLFFSRHLSFRRVRRSLNSSNIFKIFEINTEKVNIHPPGKWIFLFSGQHLLGIFV